MHALFPFAVEKGNQAWFFFDEYFKMRKRRAELEFYCDIRRRRASANVTFNTLSFFKTRRVPAEFETS